MKEHSCIQVKFVLLFGARVQNIILRIYSENNNYMKCVMHINCTIEDGELFSNIALSTLSRFSHQTCIDVNVSFVLTKGYHHERNGNNIVDIGRYDISAWPR